MTRNRNTKSSTAAVGTRFRSVFHVANVVCFLLTILVASTMKGCAGQSITSEQQQQMQQKIKGLNEEYEKDPRNADKIFMLAWTAITTNGINPMNIKFLKSAFDSETVDTPLQDMEITPLKAFLGSHIAGRYSAEQKDYKEAYKYAKMSYDYSKAKMSPNRDVGEVCTHLQLATMLDTYPSSNEDVDHSVAEMQFWANKLIDLMTRIKHKDVYLNNDWLANTMPGYVPDPYVHCVLTVFPLSFYYRADVAKIASLNYEVTTLVWPDLLYTAQHVKDFDQEQEEKKKAFIESGGGDGDEPPPIFQTCVERKIKLGVICSTLSENHSVSEDFGGILQRLDRNVFDVSYHYLHEQSTPAQSAAFLTANPSDRLFHYVKKDEDSKNGAWIRRIGNEIEEFEFDMIFYPDMTMSSWVRRLGMERLAPVQINSHGHPMTSGVPRSTMQHFVSWAEAELPPEESQTHYTEQLQLIPKGKLHQFYTPRVTTSSWGDGRISRVDNMPFDHITRKDFDELSPALQNSSLEDEDFHVYVCMQKPFKLFPEFDELLCGILKEDPKGHAILHRETQTGHENIFDDRLKKAGCDMDRVHFVSPQPAHRLMALYNMATVILDSYPAGGCTTSREALELGKAIVTWPARLLGGRWTLGLYNTIGIDEPTKKRLIADSAEDYIAKAVELGSNPAVRKDVEKNILEAIPSLFGREEAVEEWEKILLRVSPVKQCNDGDNDGKDEL